MLQCRAIQNMQNFIVKEANNMQSTHIEHNIHAPSAGIITTEIFMGSPLTLSKQISLQAKEFVVEVFHVTRLAKIIIKILHKSFHN